MGMIKLKQMMDNKFKDDTGLAVRAAKIKGINQPQKLYKFVSGETKEIDNLDAMLELVEFLFPNNHEEVFTEYCNDLDPNNQFIRDAVEYASLFEKSKMLDVLVKRLKTSTNSKGKEWYGVYELSLKSNTFSSDDISSQIEELSPKSKEMKFLSNMLLVKAYIRETKFELADDKLKTILRYENEIKKGYIKDSFTKRLNTTKVSLALRQGDQKATEKMGEQALLVHKLCPSDVYVLMDMGNAYIMHDYDIAMGYFDRALKLANDFNDQVRMIQVKNSIDFCMCYWKKHQYNNDTHPEEDYSDYNAAFYYLSVGNREAAARCLDSLEEKNADNIDMAFYYFYKGLLTNERKYHVKSVVHFKNARDKHYRKMPIIELEKLGEEDFMIEALLA